MTQAAAMSTRRETNLSQDSDALLPGKGHSPSYGINDSADLQGSSIETSGKKAPSVIQAITSPGSSGERVWVVAMCSLIACLASLINGMVIGYSSPTLSILTAPSQPPSERFKDGDIYSSLFGVSVVNAFMCKSITVSLSLSTCAARVFCQSVICMFTTVSRDCTSVLSLTFDFFIALGFWSYWCNLWWSYSLAAV